MDYGFEIGGEMNNRKVAKDLLKLAKNIVSDDGELYDYLKRKYRLKDIVKIIDSMLDRTMLQGTVSADVRNDNPEDDSVIKNIDYNISSDTSYDLPIQKVFRLWSKRDLRLRQLLGDLDNIDKNPDVRKFISELIPKPTLVKLNAEIEGEFKTDAFPFEGEYVYTLTKTVEIEADDDAIYIYIDTEDFYEQIKEELVGKDSDFNWYEHYDAKYESERLESLGYA
jgi:hypothetical protein